MVTSPTLSPVKGMVWVPVPVGEPVVPRGPPARAGRVFQVTVVGSNCPTLYTLNTPPPAFAASMVRVAESTVEPSGMPVANWSRAR